MRQAVIFHTNDVHSHFDSFLSISAAIRRQVRPGADLVLDAGDFCDQRSVMISGTDGCGGIELLKAAGYDAMAIGNNEFFAGIDAMKKMAGQGLPMLACNLRTLAGGGIPGVRADLLLERSGVRFLIIGCCPFWGGNQGNTSFTDMAGISLIDPVPLIRRSLETHRGSYDISILLSHAGYRTDCAIALAVPQLDLIIGGHSHTVMQAPLQIGHTWIHQSGSNAALLGRITLQLDAQNRILAIQAVNEAPSDKADPQLEQLLQKETALGEQHLAKALYEIQEPLPFLIDRECPAVNAIADGLHRCYGGDLGLIHHGILSCGIPQRISKLALLNAEPSPLNPTTVIYRGSQIREALAASFDPAFLHRKPDRWEGFRGTELGALAVSWNVRVIRDPLQIWIDGMPLEDEREYTVITDDFLQRGSGYAMLGQSLGSVEFHDGYIRDLLERELRSADAVRQAMSTRIESGGQNS